MAFETLETELDAACYAALGQVVTYTAQDAAAQSIYAIVDAGSALVLLGTEAVDNAAVARVQVADVATPRRGDLVTMADGTVYRVDGVERLQDSNTEWRLSLEERDR